MDTSVPVNRIDAALSAQWHDGRTGLVTFITAGDPEPAATVPAMHAMVRGGATLIELGVPFSDPEAEGPQIQAATERALAHGVSLTDTIEMVREFRRDDTTTPVILMGYLNPVEVRGYERVAREAADAGVDGFIFVNLPPEECAETQPVFDAHGLHLVFLVAPTTTDERMATIAARGRGFLYYVSLKGTTGAGHLDADSVAAGVGRLRAVTDLPVAVGFGIKTPDSAQAIAGVADAVVVGSAMVDIMGAHAGDPQAAATAVGEFCASLRAALDVADARTADAGN